MLSEFNLYLYCKSDSFKYNFILCLKYITSHIKEIDECIKNNLSEIVAFISLNTKWMPFSVCLTMEDYKNVSWTLGLLY
jgi:hypothetical protein